MLESPEARAKLRRKLELWPDDRKSPATINQGLELLDIVDSIEKEADWLAFELVKYGPMQGDPYEPMQLSIGRWRRAAREAVKEEK